MNVILDVYEFAIAEMAGFWCAGYQFNVLIFIEAAVVLAVAQRVFGSVDRFPNERSNWALGCLRQGLQNNWFNIC